jgi:bifunctional DNase/RNase
LQNKSKHKNKKFMPETVRIQAGDSLEGESDEVQITSYSLTVLPEIDITRLQLVSADKIRSFTIQINETEAQIFGWKQPGQPSLHQTVYRTIIAMFDKQDILLNKVVVHDCRNNRFFAQLYLLDDEGKIRVVEECIAYAITLAFALEAPLYVKNNIFDIAFDIAKTTEIPCWYDIDHDYTVSRLVEISDEDLAAGSSVEDLETYINIAIEKENYELAAKISRIIQQKKSETEWPQKITK